MDEVAVLQSQIVANPSPRQEFKMDTESLQIFLLASIAEPNHTKSPRKARLMPQSLMVTTIPCHPDALAEKLMVPEVSLIGVSQGRKYNGAWALLTRHSADYLSDVRPHPLTYSKVLWRRMKLEPLSYGTTRNTVMDRVSLYKITQKQAVQTKVGIVSSLPKCKYFDSGFELRNQLGIMFEFKNDTFTVRTFHTFGTSFFLDEFTPRSIILCVSHRIYEYQIADLPQPDLKRWIRKFDQVIQLFGVLDSFYTDVLVLQPDQLINPSANHEYLSGLKQVVSDRIEKYEAVLDLLLLPLRSKLELAGLACSEISALLFSTQDAVTRLKAAVESNDPQQLVAVVQTKFKDSFPQEPKFWLGLLQKFGESFWREFVQDLASKLPTASVELLHAQSDLLDSDKDFGAVCGLMFEVTNFALCQFMWQQRGSVHTISDAVRHKHLDSMQSAYKKFKFISQFRLPAYISIFGRNVYPLKKQRFKGDKSVTYGQLPQPLFRRGDYLFTKVHSTQSSANYLYRIPSMPTPKHTRNLVLVKTGCYLDFNQQQNEIFYQLVFIDRVTAAEYDLGRRARPNGLGNPTVVGGLDINELITADKLPAVDDPLKYNAFCLEFSKRWIFMVLLAGTEQYYLARMSISNDGPAPCTLDLDDPMQTILESHDIENWILFYEWYSEPCRAFPMCYLEFKSKLLMAQPFGKMLTAGFESMVELQIYLLTIDCTDDSMKVGAQAVFDSGFTVDSVVFGYHRHPVGHNSMYKPELGFYFKWQLIEGRIFGVWLKNTHEYIVYALHRERFLQVHRGKLRLGLSPAMQEYREILPNSQGAYWLPFAIGQRTAFQLGQYMSLEVQTFRLKLI